MKKEQLTNLIREALRIELKSILPKLLKELNTLPKQPSNNADIVEVTRKSLSKVRTDKPTKPKKNYKTYSNNPAINEILNETAGGIPQEGSSVSSGINETTDFQGQVVDVDALPDHVSSALTRDYSSVLKAVDKKRGKII